jgi:hypothetical protein
MVKGVNNGLVTIDEARSELGFEEFGGAASSLLVPSTVVPLEMVDMNVDQEEMAKSLKEAGYSDAEIKASLAKFYGEDNTDKKEG